MLFLRVFAEETAFFCWKDMDIIKLGVGERDKIWYDEENCDFSTYAKEDFKFETKKYWLEKSKVYGKQAILRWLQKENIDTTPNSWQERYHL